MNSDKPIFEYKRLEVIRGFLCHLAMTFDIIFPYLKGFHLTLASHLKNRNDEGWKIHEEDWNLYLIDKVDRGIISKDEAHEMSHQDCDAPPKTIKPVPFFAKCLESFLSFFESNTPPLVIDRSLLLCLVLYGFVDASKQGFGAILESPNEVKFRLGTWGPDKEDNSSNWREFANLVDTLTTKAEAGSLKQSVVIIATDNSTAEGVFYKGSSSSPLLYDLVVKLKKLELDFGLKIYITHISGERMKKQGADGLSRGHFKEVVCVGKLMSKYSPWGVTSDERPPPSHRG